MFMKLSMIGALGLASMTVGAIDATPGLKVTRQNRPAQLSLDSTTTAKPKTVVQLEISDKLPGLTVSTSGKVARRSDRTIEVRHLEVKLGNDLVIRADDVPIVITRDESRHHSILSIGLK